MQHEKARVTYFFKEEGNSRLKRNAEIWLLRKEGFSINEIAFYYQLQTNSVGSILTYLRMERDKLESKFGDITFD